MEIGFTKRKFIHLGLLSGGWFVLWRPAGAVESESVEAAAIRYQAEIEKIRPLFEKKKAPGPGDWLANRKESGQTFSQYLKTGFTPLATDRVKLYLQPIGIFSETEDSTLTILREFMHLLFGLEVVMLKKISLDGIPATAWRNLPKTNIKQILTSHVLDEILLPDRPKDAVAVLGITSSDLWPGEGWNFVFGQASLVERVGVWSTARFGDPKKAYPGFLRRVLQIAAHETGHMFGIKHCIAYECCMNGSNSLGESDRAPLFYCAECDAKLWWACKLDAVARAGKLSEFARLHSFEREEKQWRLIEKSLSPPPS